MTTLNEKKAAVQKQMGDAFIAAGWWGAEYVATGVGKTKAAIDLCAELTVILNRPPKFLISVPTQKLRDNGWKNEFTKWGALSLYSHAQMTCYASLNTFEDKHFDFVILDEGHNITYENSTFFSKNQVDRCLLITATKPTDLAKIRILKDLRLYNPVFELNIQQAVEMGLVAPYDVTIVHMKLDNTIKNIKAGSKGKYYYMTEHATYEKKYKRAEMMGEFAIMNRARFIKTLPSKTKVAQLLLTHIIPKELRTLIFCGSRKQAIQVCENRYFSKPTPPKKGAKQYDEKLAEYNEMILEYQANERLAMFQIGIVNRLSCVDALNEGENIEGLDVGFMIQLEGGKSLPVVQRVNKTCPL